MFRSHIITVLLICCLTANESFLFVLFDALTAPPTASGTNSDHEQFPPVDSDIPTSCNDGELGQTEVSQAHNVLCNLDSTVSITVSGPASYHTTSLHLPNSLESHNIPGRLLI